MFDFHEKRRFRNVFYAKTTLLFLCVVILVLVYAAFGAYQKETETHKRWKERATVLDELRGREAALQAELERLDTDKGIESEIRNKFDVAKDGEQVIVIVDDGEDDKTPIVQKKKGFFEWLFGI